MVIEKDIPLPPKETMKAQVERMEVGHSVLCGTEGRAASVRKTMNTFGFKTRTRKTPEGWRVWRAE